MKFDRLPLLEKLTDSQGILIAGAGGGFDVFSGLPLYFYLRNLGVKVHLANLSFSNLYQAQVQEISEAAFIVNASSGGSQGYFPEKYLCEWFRSQGEEVSICCFDRVGAKPIREAYERLCDLWDIDTIVLVDGGTDSLMRGDEAGLATPQEDIASIAAVNSLELDKKFLACIGFGVDTFHGVNHYRYLEAVAELTHAGHFLGAFSVLDSMKETQLFKEAYQFVESRMPQRPSIVATSIISAINGEYGDYHATKLTQGSKLWINPLMNMYWTFNLEGVANRCLYLAEIQNTISYMELTLAIENFRATHEPIKPWQYIPA